MAKGKFSFNYNETKPVDPINPNTKDDRLWKPTKDKEGNSITVFRFLPDPNGVPYQKYQDHSFDYVPQNSTEKKKYWKKCINTFGYAEDCPICKKSYPLSQSVFEEDKKLGAAWCRHIKYVANIYIIANPNNKEEEGTVRLFEFGKKIFDKFDAKVNPSTQSKELAKSLGKEVEEYWPCDVYEGANFTLNVQKTGKSATEVSYDQSSFDPQSAFMKGNDDKIEEILAKTYDLSEFKDRSKYPTNEEVIKILGYTLKIVDGQSSATSNYTESSDDIPFFENDADDIPDLTGNGAPTIDDDDAYFESMTK